MSADVDSSNEASADPDSNDSQASNSERTQNFQSEILA